MSSHDSSKADGGIGGAVADDAPGLASVEETAEVLTTLAGMYGEVPDEMREVFNANADGTAAEGGYTNKARGFAGEVSPVVEAMKATLGAVGEEGDAESVRAAQKKVREVRDLAALRVAAEFIEGFGSDDQVRYGVTKDGHPAASGLTDTGRRFARRMSERITEWEEKKGRDSKRGKPSRPAAGDVPALTDALGLREPFRVALAAGAQALAEALRGTHGEAAGGATPTPIGRRGAKTTAVDGTVLETFTLGAEPFILIRAIRMDATLGVHIVPGGGAEESHDLSQLMASALIQEHEQRFGCEGQHDPDDDEDDVEAPDVLDVPAAAPHGRRQDVRREPWDSDPGEIGLAPAPEGDLLGNSGLGWAASSGPYTEGGPGSPVPDVPEESRKGGSADSPSHSGSGGHDGGVPAPEPTGGNDAGTSQGSEGSVPASE